MSEASDFAMASSHPTLSRQDHQYLDDAQWAYLQKMEAINGRASINELLQRGSGEVLAHIARFRDYEIALEQHVLDVVTSRVAAAQATQAASVAPTISYVPSPAPPGGPKPVRVTVSQYSGAEGENLVFWQREVELAMAAGRIRDERQKVTFAISNMKDRAKVWALTCETSQPGFFRDWPSLADAMKLMFQPPNVAHRQRAAFLACRQGNRDLRSFVQELRQLRANMAANTLAEDVMLTTFMEGMNPGPEKAAVFREEPAFLEDAFVVALREDYVQRLARGLPANPAAPSPVPPVQPPSSEPMDLSVIDLSGVNLSTFDLSAIDVKALHIKCFTCGKFGHFQRDCPRNKGSARARRGRPRRSVGRGGPASASQGNDNSQ